jgi:hypothetical protein
MRRVEKRKCDPVRQLAVPKGKAGRVIRAESRNKDSRKDNESKDSKTEHYPPRKNKRNSITKQDRSKRRKRAEDQ